MRNVTISYAACMSLESLGPRGEVDRTLERIAGQKTVLELAGALACRRASMQEGQSTEEAIENVWKEESDRKPHLEDGRVRKATLKATSEQGLKSQIR